MDTRKAYGVVTAVGTKLGERARTEPDLPDRLRAAPDRPAFSALVRDLARGHAPDALVESYLADVLTDEDWVQWRARLLLQVKMVRDGGKPAPGHEKGRGPKL